ncbi:MAG: sensor histidine kinase [Bdellovibrio sp.]
MKVKIIAVLAIVSALFVSAVLWRTDSFVYGDRLSWVEAQTRTQLGAINYSLNTELKSLQRVIATFDADNFQKGKLSWLSLKPYYAAASFSVIKSGNEIQLEPQVLLTKEGSKATNWNKDFIKSAVGTLAGKTSDEKFFVRPFQDSQQGRYVALVFLENNRAYALIGSGEIFQSLIDAQKGALSAFSIVTDTGLTVGHSIPEYLGTVMRDDPVFKEASQMSSSHGSSIFKLKSGDLFGMYERVPQSNLLVLSSAPLKETMKGRSGLWWQFLLLGCGLVAVGIAAVLVVIMPTEKQIEKMEGEIQDLKNKPRPFLAVPDKVIAQDPEVLHKEKLQASMRVASALGHEMSGPLASILGYSQMILAKTPGADIVENADSIIRETRAARSVLDKLLTYAGEEVKEKNTMKVEGPLVKALKGLDSLFSLKGVKITKNIQENSPLNLNVDAIVRALTNILQNSVEAMERMANKEIKIDLHEDEQGTHLVIEDSGEGIDAKNIEKIFDPFFTSRSFQNHMGLGLSVALGILKEHNAEVQVESQKGHGTKMNILFKKLQTPQVLKAPTESSRPVVEPEEFAIASELPKLKETSLLPEEKELSQQIEEEKTVIVSDIAAKVSSPLDINIENLLELPELGEDKMESSEKRNTDNKIDTSEKTKIVKSVADELTFIDGFMDQKTVVVNKTLPVPPKAKASEGPTAAELESMTSDLSEENFIVPPKMAAKPKTSKLDSYHFEIRRPGKRI